MPMLTDFQELYPAKKENSMSNYPMHEKLKAVQDKTQSLKDFLDYLGTKKMFLATYLRDDKGRTVEGEVVADGSRFDIITLACNDHDKLISEFFEIDMVQLENEKRAMLDEIRNANRV